MKHSEIGVFKLTEIATAMGAQVSSRVHESFLAIGTDTRKDLRGQVFFALKGDQFDAHDFLDRAIAAGASAVVIHRRPDDLFFWDELCTKLTVLEVADTLKAFQDLATFWRKKMGTKVIGVTGSNGKTTTKEFTAKILGAKFKVHFAEGSFNNHWGVPITLLGLRPEHEVAVIEMGLNHHGELGQLMKIVRPDIVGVTMVGRSHIEGLGSLEGVAQAKAVIYEDAPQNSIAIFNLDNPWTLRMRQRFQGERSDLKILSFGEDSKTAEIAMTVESFDDQSMVVLGRIGEVQGKVRVDVYGRHNLTNIMAAAAFALSAGMNATEIWNALKEIKTIWGRNHWVTLKNGARVLFDGYNANPESMAAALTNFAALPRQEGQKKIVVLGAMLELGEEAGPLHRELGELAARGDFDWVGFVGKSHREFSEGFRKTLFVSDSYELALAQKLEPVLNPNDLILVKGSRGMALERLVTDLGGNISKARK